MAKKEETKKVELKQAIELAEEKTTQLEDSCRFKVNSQPTFEKAGEMLKSLKEYKNFVQEQKDSIVKPLNEALKNARAVFAPVEDRIATVETYLKGSVLKYNQKLQEEAKKREAEAQKRIESGESFETATKSVGRVEEKIAAIPTRKVQKLVIDDLVAIPRDFLVPDESKIKEALKSGYKVAGCRLVEEEIVVNTFK